MSLRKPIYGYVFSLGQWCATAMCMKKAGLRSCSGPFDWMGFHQPLSCYVDILVSDFSSCMLKKNLSFVKEDPAEGVATYEDCATGLSSVHDFRIGVPFDEMYVRFRKVFDRRIGRLLDVLRRGGVILFVHYRGEGRYAPAELTEAAERLRMKFPKSTVDLLVLETERGVPGLIVEEIGPGIIRMTGDFYDQRRFDAVVGNEALVLKALRRVRLRGKWRNVLHERISSFKRRLSRRGRRGAE